MKKSFTQTRRSIALSLFVFGILATLALLPTYFQTEAGNQEKNKGLFQRTHSHTEGLENYDIRTDKTVRHKIESFRSVSSKNASAIADVRDNFVSGENELKRRVPTLKVEYNSDLRTPEVIAPDVRQGRAFLESASGGGSSRAEMLRSFAKENENLLGVTGAQADDLKVTADYTNPDGNLSFAHLEQFIGGVPVFRGEIKAGFNKSGEMIRVINNLAPGLEYDSLSDDFRNPLDAVKAAATHINLDANKLDLTRNDAASDDSAAVFGTGDSATVAEKMYFPTEPGVAIPAWRVAVWQPIDAFYVIVDAANGTLLWRKNVTEDQTQAATYSVYRNANAMIDVADSPFPFTPGPVSPNSLQGAPLNRANVTRIGNEAPYTFNNNGWITDGGTRTDGNAIQAGLDRDGTDGVDPNSEAVSASRNFAFNYNPLNPNTNTGDAPVPAAQTYPGSEFQQGTVTQMFYIANWYHDELYRLGFTEQARNFQDNNFGRGGAGGDRIRGEGQDSSGTNNANFSAFADGTRGRMQMYIWTGANPDIDGNLDAEVVIHEITHGTSNRLHGNSSGLSTNMARGMGEGWSDFYAHCLLSEPTDPINGVYTIGGYDTYLGVGGFVNNYYYGIRRFPKAIIAFTGGANNRPHNPLTFADADATQFNISDGAFARGPFGSGTADQVHNLGEIWSSALWEVRAKMVTRLGWANGNRKVLQLVTDGMKLAPLNPTFLQERDAIIAAAQASGSGAETAADVADLWAGFAVRGMGAGAVVLNPGSGASNARVTQAFDLPNLVQTQNLLVGDAAGNNNGFPEPGENVTIAFPLTNNGGIAATGTTVQIVGGGSANYGTITNNQTVSQPISFTVPAGTACGSALNLTFNVNSGLGATSFTRTIIIGVPITTFTENFDFVTAPALPAGWTATVSSGGANFVTTNASSDSAPNSVFALNVAAVGGGTDLTSPAIPVTSPAAVLSFRHRFDTEPAWDGGTLEISIAGGAFQDVIAAGGRFIENGYNGVLGTATTNPLSDRNAWSGLSDGYIRTRIQLPASAAGQSVQFRWRFGSDDNTTGTGANPGWNVDTIQLAGNYSCGTVAPAGDARADFDGDGKTDLSVFRPSNGVWYLQRSQNGFGAVSWGQNGDVLVPGDYDNDGKTDTAVFRNGSWFVLQSSNSTLLSIGWGLSTDTPAAGDYDGDGKADAAVFRSSNSTWYINKSSGGFSFVTWGQAGDIPLVGDFDGDGKADLTVFRSGQWITSNSNGGNVTITSWGLGTDKLVPADYDGDNRDDLAVFRPADGTWYIQKSTGGFSFVTFGTSGDVPVPGDYDGDGRSDQAVYRGGVWYLNRSTSGFAASSFGVATDTAVPSKYIP